MGRKRPELAGKPRDFPSERFLNVAATGAIRRNQPPLG